MTLHPNVLIALKIAAVFIIIHRFILYGCSLLATRPVVDLAVQLGCGLARCTGVQNNEDALRANTGAPFLSGHLRKKIIEESGCNL